ncbi:MAG: hypothetical protein AAF958_09210 [Planctomycetota bacterium]
MNIQPSSAAAAAGTIRAAARGGNREEQMMAESKSATTELAGAGNPAAEASGETGDRGGDGRQVLDEFESHDSREQSGEDPPPESNDSGTDRCTGDDIADSTGHGLDLLA